MLRRALAGQPENYPLRLDQEPTFKLHPDSARFLRLSRSEAH